jgi:hypothetical protein
MEGHRLPELQPNIKMTWKPLKRKLDDIKAEKKGPTYDLSSCLNRDDEKYS